MEPSNGGKIPANYEKRQGEPYDVRRLHTARKQSAIMSMFDGLKPDDLAAWKGLTLDILMNVYPSCFSRLWSRSLWFGAFCQAVQIGLVGKHPMSLFPSHFANYADRNQVP